MNKNGVINYLKYLSLVSLRLSGTTDLNPGLLTDKQVEIQDSSYLDLVNFIWYDLIG